jgi:hypothetical protein
MTEQIEQRAQEIWGWRLIPTDVAKLAHKYGFTKEEIIWLDWDGLPEKIRDHIREMAEAEIDMGNRNDQG